MTGRPLFACVLPVHTCYQKIGVVVVDGFSVGAMRIAQGFRAKKIPVNIAWGKTVKGQLSYLKKSGWNENLIYIGEEEGFFLYQDTHEYPQWLCDEYGTVNFEKVKYPISEKGIEQCISEQLLIEVFS